MPSSSIFPAKVLVFNSLADISNFKHECLCSDFYVDRDLLTLVGYFSEEQVAVAITKYKASLNPEKIV